MTNIKSFEDTRTLSTSGNLLLFYFIEMLVSHVISIVTHNPSIRKLYVEF